MPTAPVENPPVEKDKRQKTTIDLETPWVVESQTILDELGVSPSDGLSTAEAEARVDQYGPNRLRQIEPRSTWNILLDQLKSLIIYVLIAAAVVSFARQNWIDGGAIVVVLLVNTAIGFFTELKATRSIEALRELNKVESIVRRNGKKRRISAAEVVPGDIVLLESGELISADIRVIQAIKLQADESALTGESVPVDKQAEPVAEDTPLAERHNMVFKGTAITRGQGEGVVVATGMETEIGEISALVEGAEDEDTPLEERLDKLGRKLVWVTLGVAAVVAVIGLLAQRDLQLMIETAVALAIAAVPEGLPIVATVALARGMWRMLDRNALIRKLSSVETLGATNVICTDKTGTLTENQMTVQKLALVSNTLDVRPEANGNDIFQNGKGPMGPDENPTLETALKVGMLCNDAEPQEARAKENGQKDVAELTGDPMEIALLKVGQQAGLSRDELKKQMPEVNRDAFDRETKQMATIHKTDEGYFVAVKGAPQNVLEGCTHLFGQTDEPEPFDDQDREAWQERVRNMAKDGLRVLALATKTMDSPDDEIYKNLAFLGLIGLMDPPRADVRDAIDRCQEAGIRVVMITGDQPDTARAIAKSVGLVDDAEADVLAGSEFGDPESASSEERQRMLNTSIFARVTPAQKLNLIDLHQDNNSIVAMTGDGVNDAPALKSADIGIAMGKRGTQVAREAADMILQDDAFPTIVVAVEQGRVIFENIRKFVIYLLSGNVGIILAIALATVAAIPLPLLPLQILYLNMINDVFPALALGVGSGYKQVMDRPPRAPSESVITRYHWGEIVGYGVLIGLNLLATFFVALQWLGMDQTTAVTCSFLTLSISRLFHVFNMRSADTGIIRNEITENLYVWGAIVLSLALLLIAIYWPLLANVLQLTGIGVTGWTLVLSASLVPLVIGQIYLTFFKKSST